MQSKLLDSLNPRFMGSNPAEGEKICSIPSFGHEVKAEASSRKILWHVKGAF
jgi:hypothetical protein